MHAVPVVSVTTPAGGQAMQKNNANSLSVENVDVSVVKSDSDQQNQSAIWSAEEVYFDANSDAINSVVHDISSTNNVCTADLSHAAVGSSTFDAASATTSSETFDAGNNTNTVFRVQTPKSTVRVIQKPPQDITPSLDGSSIMITATDIQQAQAADDCISLVMKILSAGNTQPTGFESENTQRSPTF